MHHPKYTCAKCGNRDFEKDEMSTAGGAMTRIFDIQNRRFITLSCTKCGFTELYKKPKGKTWENILDLFTT